MFTPRELTAWKKKQPARVKNWIKVNRFRADPGKLCLVPNAQGNLAAVLLGAGASVSPWESGGLARRLPKGKYSLELADAGRAEALALGWGLGAYQFRRDEGDGAPPAQLLLPDNIDRARVEQEVAGTTLVRDLINTPAEELGPAELAAVAKGLAKEHGASCKVISGDALGKGFPLVAAVGRASSRPPRLVDLRWGKRGKKLTLVGKGICFDSGGLDLKPASGMLLMRKDMGGAAHVLGLARMIMMAELPVRLRVLVPTADNSVSGNAIRPGDVFVSRSGLSVEINNTDAEGRLVLCDALTYAVEDEPDCIIDFATLTGAARVALGTDLPALFSHSDELANGLLESGLSRNDPLWRMPLHQPYVDLLRSNFADTANISESRYGGAITAALYLQKFVPKKIPWAHLDLMGWNSRTRAGRPRGGEAMGLRAAFDYVMRALAEE